ncbi:MAG: glycosyltransferase family 4 protein [Kordiimonadaceae bacterium]|nr:glycosyltransferase family 4 protein [Kordiimonadaceae bacterium]
MRILLLSNMYPSAEKQYSGIYVKNFYEVLKGNKLFDVNLQVMKRTYTGVLGSFFKYLNFSMRFLAQLTRKYDVVHLHFFYPLIYLAVLYKFIHPRTILIVTYHGTDIQNHGTNQYSLLLFRWCAKYVNHHIAVGKELAKTVSKKLGVSNVDVVPAGIDENVFFLESKTEKNFDFIFVGSFYAEKGIPEYISAIKSLNNKKIRFCFVGSGPLLNELMKLNTDFSVSIFQNQTQSQIRQLFNQSRFMVLPSKRESFGLVASEALFCGTPAIVSPVGGLVEQVKNNYNGLVINKISGSAIKEALEKALSIDVETYNIMKKNAVQSNKQFSLKNVMEFHRNLYIKLISEHNSNV